MNYLLPEKIVQSENVENGCSVLKHKPLQIGLGEKNCLAVAGKGFICFDFGKETHGGVRILTSSAEGGIVKIRIRFGESLAETYSDIGYKNSTNDHSPRDFFCDICSLSDLTFGQTGFRFARIDFIESKQVKIKAIVAEEKILNIDSRYVYNGDDELIARIFDAAKRTIDLCASGEYLWDGIKRDRLVWMGDIYPEMLALTTLYGRTEIVEKSLDFIKEATPLPSFMNDMPTYSMWWIIVLYDYYRLIGCKDFLDRQIDYLEELVKVLNSNVGENGELNYDIFVDWPTRGDKDETTGTRCINLAAAEKAAKILEMYGKKTEYVCEMIEKLKKGSFEVKSKKQVIGLKYYALGEISNNEYELLINGGAAGLSTFMSYFILTAIASRDKKLAAKIMKEYYGKMLDLGATTFWEDFDVSWAENAGKIDVLPVEGKVDIHGDFGAFCYVGYRHSLCHGWSSGVIKFIEENC